MTMPNPPFPGSPPGPPPAPEPRPNVMELASALEACDGLPVPSPVEYARRLDEQLAARGYQITRIPVRRTITGYPCTCANLWGCLEHPFGPPRSHPDTE